MVNQDKVRLITKVECYRQREKRGALWTNRFTRWSYVSQKMVKSWILCTVATLIVVLLWAICNFDWLLSIYDVDKLVDLGTQIIGGYLVAALIMVSIAGWTYTRRYKKARSSVKRYYVRLRRLNDYYEKSRKKLVGQKAPARKDGEQ